MAKYTQICGNEYKLQYSSKFGITTTFLLIEQRQGKNGYGKVMALYYLDGFKREFIKNIGWTKTDDDMPKRDIDFYLQDIVSIQDCLKGAVEYLSKLYGLENTIED